MSDATESSKISKVSAIEAWYSQVSFRFVDLVSDYAGKESFIVEGDNLLRDCFSDPRIDFGGKIDVQIIVDLLDIAFRDPNIGTDMT
jgi:hypothetical protein